MPQQAIKHRSDLYDPTMPDANSVMASLLCVTTTYANRPSLELAKLALNLAETFTAPEYAETALLCEVSKRVYRQWNNLVQAYEHASNDINPKCENMNLRS